MNKLNRLENQVREHGRRIKLLRSQVNREREPDSDAGVSNMHIITLLSSRYDVAQEILREIRSADKWEKEDLMADLEEILTSMDELWESAPE